MLFAEAFRLAGEKWKGLAIRANTLAAAFGMKQADSYALPDALVGNPNRFVDFSKRQLCPDWQHLTRSRCLLQGPHPKDLEGYCPGAHGSGMTAELLNARSLTCRPAFINQRKALRELNSRVQVYLLAVAARDVVMCDAQYLSRRNCVLLRRFCIDEQQQFDVTQAIPCPLSV